MKSVTHLLSRQETEKHPHQILAENPLQPSVLKAGASVRPDNFPSLLTQQPYWLPADQKKIPVLPETDIYIKGERLCHCQSWQAIKPLISPDIHPYAVYLHNQQEPYITLDVDHGRNPDTGEPAEWLQPLFKELGIQWNATVDRGEADRYPYIEISSSGTGYHVLFQGKTDYGKRCWFTTEERGKDCPKIEIIAYNNLITYTGNQLPCSGQKALPIDSLLDYLKRTYPKQHITLPPVDTTQKPAVPQWRQRQDNELTADLVADMLDRINPDCHHDEWKQIGMAVHAWNSGHMGKDLWLQWSRGGEKFDSEAAKAIDSAWKGFRSGKGISVGTLVKSAMDNGFVFPKRDYNNTVSVPSAPEKRQKPCSKGTEENTSGDPKQPVEISSVNLATVTNINEQTDLKRQINNRINQLVEDYNQHFIHVVSGSKNVIMVKRQSEDYPKQEEWIPMKIHEFKDMLLHEELVMTGFKKNRNKEIEEIYKSPADIWLKHPKASFCNKGTTFWPQETQWHNGRLNLFCGFAVDPMPCDKDDPDVKLWKTHLLNIVCYEDENLAKYVLRWFAYLIQFPHKKPKTAIIMKGLQGTGKGSLIEPLLEILGVHGVHLCRPGSVSGRFNAVIENKLLIFADEAVFNNRKDSNILKSLVSEKRAETEKKGLDMTNPRNYSRLLLAADQDHVIKVSGAERRYLVLQMSTNKIQDLDYFGKLNQAIKNGLPAKLLYTLQQIDLSNFIPMDVPKTKWLTEDKLHDLKPEQQFIYETLFNGGLSLNAWHARIEVNELRTYFYAWLNERNIKFHGDAPIKLGIQMKAIGAEYKDRTYYEVKELEESRKNFELNILNGSVVEWPKLAPVG